jgi:hypothetical protein
MPAPGTVARQWVVPHVIEFDPELREALLTLEDYLGQLWQEIQDIESGVTPAPAPPIALTDLTDVNTVGYTDGTVLQFSSAVGLWLPQQLALSGGDLTDVSTAAPNNKDVLRWNDTAGPGSTGMWVPESLPAALGATDVLTVDGSGVGRYWYGAAANGDPVSPNPGDLWFATRLSADPISTPTAPTTAPTVTVT